MIEPDLTTDEVAAALRLNKVTVQRLLKQGRLKGYQIGRSWRIPPNAVEEFRTRGLCAVGRPLQTTVAKSTMAGSEAEELDAWEKALLAEDDLAAAPPIPLEAMRRENLYEDRN